MVRHVWSTGGGETPRLGSRALWGARGWRGAWAGLWAAEACGSGFVQPRSSQEFCVSQALLEMLMLGPSPSSA